MKRALQSGDRIKIFCGLHENGGEYMVARTGCNRYQLICTKTGNRWDDDPLESLSLRDVEVYLQRYERGVRMEIMS